MRLFKQKREGLYYQFKIAKDLLSLLDTESVSWHLSDEQFRFLLEAINEYKGRNIFILMHSVLWANHTPLEIMMDNWSHRYFRNQFWQEIFPELRRKSTTKFYVFAGDVGGNDGVIPASYQHLGNVRLIPSGMGHHPEEN